MVVSESSEYSKSRSVESDPLDVDLACNIFIEAEELEVAGEVFLNVRVRFRPNANISSEAVEVEVAGEVFLIVLVRFRPRAFGRRGDNDLDLERDGDFS
jgi:hypothetical protein